VPAPRDTDTGGPRRRARARRRKPYRPPRTFRTEQAAPQRRPAPRKGPVAPQGTGGGTSDRNPPIPSRPRPTAPGGTFEPFRRKRGLERQTERARKKTVRAEKRLPENKYVPHIPVIAEGYTAPQKAEIRRLLKRSAKQGGYKSIDELYRDASPNQRRQLRQVGRIVTFGAYAHIDPSNRQRIQARNVRDTVRAGEETGALGKRALSAGLAFTPGRLPETFGDITKTAWNVLRAGAESPGRVGSSSFQQGREMFFGIPQSAKEMLDAVHEAAQGRGTGELQGIARQMLNDYEERYGSADDDPEAFRERVKSEWGLTPFALDALMAASGTGQLAGLAARSGRVGRAAAALAENQQAPPGARPVARAVGAVHRAATSERPTLRYSAGEEGVARQRRSRNLWTVGGQQAIDARRRRWAAKQEAKPRRSLIVSELREGEVTPITRGLGASFRERPALRPFTGRVARQFGRNKGTGRVLLIGASNKADVRIDEIMRRLEEPERVLVREMAELGVKPDAKGVAALKLRLAKLEANPDADVDGDMAVLREALKDPESYLTPRAREAVDELRALQVESATKDPTLPAATELLNRVRAQADLLDVKRGPNVQRFRETLRKIEEKTGVTGLARYADEVARADVADRPEVAHRLLDEAEKQVESAEQRVDTQKRRLAVAKAESAGAPETAWFNPRPNARDPKPGRGFIDDRGQLHTWDEETGAHLEMQRARGKQSVADIIIRPDGTVVPTGGVARPGRALLIDEAEAVARAVMQDRRLKPTEAMAATPEFQKALDEVRGDYIDKARVQRRELELRASRAARDHVRDFEKALRKVHKKATSQARKQDNPSTFDPRLLEGAAEFAERVRKAADDAGLAEPMYWRAMFDEDIEIGAPRLKAIGGTRATEMPKRSRGVLAAEGRGSRDSEVIRRGIQTNLKRRYQYELVIQNIRLHAAPWSRGDGDTGLKVDQIKKQIADRRLDPDTLELMDTRIIDRRRDPEQELDSDPALDPADEFLATFDGARHPAPPLTSRDWDKLAQHRYLVYPREVGEAVGNAAAKLDGKALRRFEIAFMRLPARLMLGLSPPWLMFQFASNASLAGLVGRTLNPFDFVEGVRWSRKFRAEDPEGHAVWEAENGITHNHHAITEQPNLGRLTDEQWIAAWWRGFKRTHFMRVAHRMNPLNAMFRMDEELNNNFFRTALFYSKARKAAYRRMGRNIQGSSRNIDNLINRVLAKPPDRRPQAIATHGRQFEETAQQVRDILGDYMTYTPAERQTLGRFVMFYGYLRFSLKFVFHTMPVGHPIMTNILAQMGEMGSDEIKKLLGVPEDYDLPASMLAQVYLEGDDGSLRSINYGRMNPFINAVTQMERPTQAFGLVSPMYQSLADQAFNESAFTGRDFQIEGRIKKAPPEGYYGSYKSLLRPGSPRNRIFARQQLKMLFPYRLWEEAALEPSQTDDALAWSPRPLKIKEEEARRGINRDRRKWREKSTSEKLAPDVFPFLSKPSPLRAVLKRRLEEEADMRNQRLGKKKPRKRRRSSSRYGGGSSNRYGGSGGNPYGG
jgi:hypothetical protein